MINFILLLFIFLFGCLVGGFLFYINYIKKKIRLYSDEIENRNEYLVILDSHNKIEQELVEYKNQFSNKYVDDGYDAY